MLASMISKTLMILAEKAAESKQCTPIALYYCYKSKVLLKMLPMT